MIRIIKIAKTKSMTLKNFNINRDLTRYGHGQRRGARIKITIDRFINVENIHSLIR